MIMVSHKCIFYLRIFYPHSNLFNCLCNLFKFTAFVLQAEGEIRWQLFAPHLSSEVLSTQFSDVENMASVDFGEPFFDEILGSGDLLYFPRHENFFLIRI